MTKLIKYMLVIAVLSALTIRTSFSQNKEKRYILWFDASANFNRFIYPDSIAFYLKKTKDVGITDVIIDVKPISGDVLFRSEIAPLLSEWRGVKRIDNFDYLQSFIREGHKLGLKVHAALNVFCEGHNYFDKGLVYTRHPEWQSKLYEPQGIRNVTDNKSSYEAMVNPANNEVRKYELSLIKEVVAKYKSLDGVILDRVRYNSITADFSLTSRNVFESYLGYTVSNYPEDIFRYEQTKNGSYDRIPGPLYQKWIEWRASVIYSFMKEARSIVKNENSSVSFGAYTGAWFPSYYEVGVNWASTKYDPSASYEWASKNYRKFGYAELLDFYTNGCYFFEVTNKELNDINPDQLNRKEPGMTKELNSWYTVEGASKLTKTILGGVVPHFSGLFTEDYRGDQRQFEKALRMAINESDGVMVFDIVHIINRNWWKSLERVILDN